VAQQDAAHIHSPIGGQGMNTGLQDAWNLVWKLDLALRGHASALLIDSYNAERTPAIRRVIRMTDLMTRALGTPNRLAQTARDLAIPILFRLPAFRHTMVQRLSQLGVCYAGSPIVKGEGRRYFDETLRGGNGICSKFLLMLGNEADQSTKDAAQKLNDAMRNIMEVRTTSTDGLKLIRPNGYIALRASNAVDAIGMAGSMLRKMTITPHEN